MNELIESDQELNAGGDDCKSEGGEFSSDSDFFDEERSLAESDDETKRLRARKAKEAKVNNSFTGPYPLDPTDFNHNDKGINAQFYNI
jgi:hypothetical protein